VRNADDATRTDLLGVAAAITAMRQLHGNRAIGEFLVAHLGKHKHLIKYFHYVYNPRDWIDEEELAALDGHAAKAAARILAGDLKCGLTKGLWEKVAMRLAFGPHAQFVYEITSYGEGTATVAIYRGSERVGNGTIQMNETARNWLALLRTAGVRVVVPPHLKVPE
jgi:hypothetical protein